MDGNRHPCINILRCRNIVEPWDSMSGDDNDEESDVNIVIDNHYVIGSNVTAANSSASSRNNGVPASNAVVQSGNSVVPSNNNNAVQAGNNIVVPANTTSNNVVVPANTTGNNVAVPANTTGNNVSVPANTTGSNVAVPANTTGNSLAVFDSNGSALRRERSRSFSLTSELVSQARNYQDRLRVRPKDILSVYLVLVELLSICMSHYRLRQV